MSDTKTRKGPETQPDWDGERCRDCGRGYALVWYAPDDLWKDIWGNGGGTLCPDCFHARCEERGRYVYFVIGPLEEEQRSPQLKKFRQELARDVGKEVAARNALCQGLFELAQALQDDPDLHGKLLTSTWKGGMGMVPTGEPDEDGRVWYRTDLTQPHHVIRVQVEIVGEDSESELSPEFKTPEYDW